MDVMLERCCRRIDASRLPLSLHPLIGKSIARTVVSQADVGNSGGGVCAEQRLDIGHGRQRIMGLLLEEERAVRVGDTLKRANTVVLQ